ncbi:MAG: M23 family metallopeptidase [Betaproteobacteria bacterium]|nr:M23 family metallopeptidase [Betaproteobacteria bacterium]
MITHKSTILAQSVHASARRPAWAPTAGQWLAAALFGISGAAAFGLVANTAPEMTPISVIRLDLPQPAVSIVAADGGGYWREDRIRRGDTIGSVLARLGVVDPEAMAFLRTNPSARPLYMLRPGKPLSVETDGEGLLVNLRFVTGDGERLTIARRGDELAAQTVAAPVETQWQMAAGEIRSSLFGAADEAGLPDAVTLQMADVFGGDIDFYHDLRRGDRFSVVYEMRYIDGEPVGAGRIVAAEFVNGGRALRALLWRGDDGREDYFTDDGAPMRKAFLRSPMEFSRVTSGFSNARFHPIMRDWRAHKGVDYAAPTGTPVRATSNAKVKFAGKQNGYGNVIELRHQGAFSTLYAHLSRFAPHVRTGARVAQGEVIGYVGQTGWATGPHLHYEFRVGGEQRNPLTVALPSGEPLGPEHRLAFAERTAPAVAQLALAERVSGAQLASSE